MTSGFISLIVESALRYTIRFHSIFKIALETWAIVSAICLYQSVQRKRYLRYLYILSLMTKRKNLLSALSRHFIHTGERDRAGNQQSLRSVSICYSVVGIEADYEE